MDGDCLKGVRRTAGVIAADLAVERADRGPIGLEQGNQDIFHRRAPVFTGLDRGLDRTLPKHWSRSAASWGPEAAPEAGVARTTSTPLAGRSEEHTSELQSLMRNSYAVFCLKKKTT